MLLAHTSTTLDGECLVIAIVIFLVVTLLAWAVPPTRPWCLGIGAGAGALYLLFGCVL